MGLRTVAIIILLGAVAPSGMFAQRGVTAYEQATALLRQGMVKQAEEVLRTDLRDHPKDDHDLNLLGTILDAQERFDEAEEVYSRALHIAPNSPFLLNNLGNHYAAEGQIDRARAAYLRVIELDAHHANANLHLAQISIAQNHGQDALGDLDNLLEPDKSSTSAQLLRAEALHLTGQEVSSLEVLDQLEKQYPKTPSVIFSVGLIFVDWGRYDDAERVFTKALAVRPTDTNILYNLGLAATRAGHFDRAEQAFQSVLKQRPVDVGALSGLARLYEAEGHDERAVDFLSKAHRLAPGRPEILLTLGQVEEKRGHYAESAKALDECLRLDPNNSAAKREFAFALAHTAEFNRGLAQLTSYIETNPQDPVGFYELALAETEEGGEKALNHLNQAIVLDPNYLPPRFARAVLNDKAGRPADSVSDLTLILERNPNDARALDLLGRAQAAQNQNQEAVTSLLRATQLAPNDVQILMHFSRALLRVNRKEESNAVLAKLEQTGVPYRPSRLFEHAGPPPQEEAAHSVASLENQVQANPGDINARVRLAGTQLASGQTEKALASFDKLLEDTSDVRILAGCGKTLLENRQYAEARKFLEKASSPNSPPEVRLDFATALSNTSGAEAALANLDQMPVTEREGEWYLLAAQFLSSMGKDREAIAKLNEGLAAVPPRPDLYFEVARFLLDHSLYHEAVDLLGKAVQAFPADPKLLLCQALAYSFIVESEESERLLAEIELRWPDWSQPYLVNGIILVGLHRSAEAKPLIGTAIALGDTDALAYFNLALADLDGSPSDTRGAQQAVSRAVKVAPEDPYVQWLAGKVSYLQKDYGGAVQHLQAALHSWPDMVEAHMQLSSTYRALGDKEKSDAELKEVSRLKESQRSAAQTPAHLTSPMGDLLISVRPPE